MISQRNPRKFGDFPLSKADRSRELIFCHVEAPCESGYPCIANVPFDLVREKKGEITAKRRTIYPADVRLLLKLPEVRQQCTHQECQKI